MPDDSVLRVENLSKVYRSGESDLVIFSGLNLEVRRGENLALVGESGAGKSTLLHLLGGLDSPTTGRISYAERPDPGRIFESDIGASGAINPGSDQRGEPKRRHLTEMSRAELAEYRNRQVAFVWQMHYLLPEFTALENVAIPLMIRGDSRAEAAKVAVERLKDVGLSERGHHRAGELSGGEQQRVVLARALAAGPEVLLADEPTGNLDAKTGEMVFSLLERIHRQHGLTTVMVTHNLEFARRCDRALKLQNGALVPMVFSMAPQTEAGLTT